MRYDIDSCALIASVREICALATKSGDIDSRRPSPFSAKYSEKTPAEIHSALQKSRGGEYQREVVLTNTTLCGDIYYQVSGRADGVIYDGGCVTVEEIKTVSGYEMSLPPNQTHLAQLRAYAYFICVGRGLDRITARLTYYNDDSKKERNIDKVYTVDELRLFYQSLLMRVERWALLEKHRAEELLPSLANAVFPYRELREGQRDLINEAYSTIKSGKRLFAQAPTGTGKTISALYPAVKAMGSGLCDKIFYLTAKSSTSREAYNAVGKLFEAGAKLRTCAIGAKEQVCLCDRAKNSPLRVSNFCNPDDCPYAKGYYDRVDGAIFELLSRQNGYNLKIINEVARTHTVCPYELSLDLSEVSDVVICDYNYLFSPSVYMRRYFADGGKGGKYVFLIDEAHNLGDRARDMYSATLSRNDAVRLLGLIDRDRDSRLFDCFDNFCISAWGLRRLCRDNLKKESDGTESGFYMSRNPLASFNEDVADFVRGIEPWLKANREHPLYGDVFGVYSAAKSYLLVLEYYDDRFLTYVMVFGGDITVRLYCLDPSDVLSHCMSRGAASVLFSATFTPLDYFSELLGGGKRARFLNLPSPFKQENLFVGAVDTVSTRFDDRNEKTYKRIAAFIAAAVSPRPGNYIVYFPSYSFMEGVKQAFEKRFPKVKLIVQSRGMGRNEKERFLAEFKEDSGKLRIGMCVLGGSFSEGVDLPGNKLIGTVVVGVGLPGISNENNIIKEYYDIKSECGYDYAYTFPGMNNVLQAAGRVIRRDTDKGIVILIDDRYADPKYKMLFPPQWSHLLYMGDPQSLAKAVGDFWQKIDETGENQA